MEDLKPVIGNVNGEEDLAKTQLKVRLHNELLVHCLAFHL